MCGIAGHVGRTALSAESGALQLLAHRGTDGTDGVRRSCHGKELWLGHTRLAILDLSSAGQQPMTSRDGRWQVTFNGEIYNHRELREEIPGPWHGHSDTETLVEALAAWGLAKTLGRLNGMFAFAAVDLVDSKLYLTRDPFGIKPLYFTGSGDSFAFASEIRALAVLTGSRFPIDRDALQTFLSLRFNPSPQTLLGGIRRLPAGHYLQLDIADGMESTHRYAGFDVERFQGTMDDAVEQYHVLLQRAVGRQMLSDVPLGILLSGGIDSAFIAAVAASVEHRTPCFSVGFGEQFAECELADAEETARILGLPFHPIQLTHEELWSVFSQSVAAIEEPLGTSSILPMWHLSKRARERVTVVLTGQGSDEPWGGYRRYQSELLRALPFAPYLAKCLSGAALGVLKLPEHMVRALHALPRDDQATRFEQAYCLFDSAQRLALTGRSDGGNAVPAISYWLAALPPDRLKHGAEAMMAIDSRMELADDLLLYGDKVSMAHSLEARVPMLDLELVRFVESLPLSYRARLKTGKVVHKQAAQKYLPSRIVHRRKRSFSVPFGDWIRTCWRDRAAAVLFDAPSPHLDWVAPAGIRAVWQAHQDGRADCSRQLFALLALAFWSKAMERSISGSAQPGRTHSGDEKNAYLV